MKKTISTVAAITVAFAGLAFIPAKKNTAMEEAVVATDAEAAKTVRCDETFETEVIFTRCKKTWTEVSSAEEIEQVDVLDKY